MVIEVEPRLITLAFHASEELRTYRTSNAPLTRLIYRPGDSAESKDGWRLTIDRVTEDQGLLIYHGQNENGQAVSLPESSLGGHADSSAPQDRLFKSQVDGHHWFDLRRLTHNHLHRLEQSPLLGLGGGRIELLPHQLYIAHEVGHRAYPRALLADEVGLGKTIEACLILHHQLLTGRASRALILVPEPLIHQWIVELLRRFNLRFSLLDEERCEAIVESGQGDNPFLSEQLVLTSLETLLQHPERAKQAQAGTWDLLIVDEAHHLTWTPEHASDAYILVEALTQSTPGVLLLTATPEQLGEDGHFARLRLLDPDRYYDLEQFHQEAERYRPIARLVDLIQREQPMSDDTAGQLRTLFNEQETNAWIETLTNGEASPAATEEAREQLLEMILDRHGAGRVLFRNNRQRIQGFTQRELHAYPLANPYDLQAQGAGGNSLTAQLTPEAQYQPKDAVEWHSIDPRIDWLADFAKADPARKILVICALADTATSLSVALWSRRGVRAALFHEYMTIIERDRAAAWFADHEQGAQLLICSEIGSEGRNFQFAHDLVLFDLPLDPDLLEQRIGRLDRIGQRSSVQIHVPYLMPGPQAVTFDWFNQGLNAFMEHTPGGSVILETMKPALAQAFDDVDSDQTDPSLIEATLELCEAHRTRLQQGRDHLLELASCREPTASKLRDDLSKPDQDDALSSYCESLFNAFNIDVEPINSTSLALHPGEQITAEPLPHIPDSGISVTFERQTALAHEDRAFMSWEHPMIRDAMELVTRQPTGNSTAIKLSLPGQEPGQLWLEQLYVIRGIAPKKLQIGRFLPPTAVHVVIDHHGKRLDIGLDEATIAEYGQPLERQLLSRVIQQYREVLSGMLDQGSDWARTRSSEITQNAVNQMTKFYQREISRLVALQVHNPNIRPIEIETLEEQSRLIKEHLQNARLQLDALRLIVTI